MKFYDGYRDFINFEISFGDALLTNSWAETLLTPGVQLRLLWCDQFYLVHVSMKHFRKKCYS